MRCSLKVFFIGASIAASCGILPPVASSEVYGASVDAKGSITFPADFRSQWVHLGSRLVTSALTVGSGLDRFAPGRGFHDVYTQPSSLQSYKKTGAWPDGSMLIMEVRSVKWDDLPTGHVMTQGEPVKWLVMVKDVKNRFTGHPGWGKGWGWALFNPQDPAKNLSSDFKTDCLGCHDTAKDTDLVFSDSLAALGK